MRTPPLHRIGVIPSKLRIPTEAGQGYRFDVGHRSDLSQPPFRFISGHPPWIFGVFGWVSNSGIFLLVINHEED
jgi:hypothetical protein